jgi:hypothetical protein
MHVSLGPSRERLGKVYNANTCNGKAYKGNAYEGKENKDNAC